MSFASLPDVLVQTIMQSLDAAAILALAGCSKWTSQCAVSPFAWRSCPPVLGRLDRSDEVIASSFATSRFLRFRTLSVWLNKPHVERVIQLAARLPLAELRVMPFANSDQPTQRVLSDPAVQRTLRSLSLLAFGSETMRLVAQLPVLHTLELGNSGYVNGSVCAPLIRAPALTSLTVHDAEKDRRLSVVPLLCKLPRLLSLRIAIPELNASNWLPFCNAMWQLQSLSLCSWLSVSEIPRSELSAGFVAMRMLVSLRIEKCAETDRILPALPAMASLRLLTLIHIGGVLEEDLVTLLTAAPQLRLTMQLKATQQFTQFGQTFAQRATILP